jgi:predicted PhzF superfamily epimerase YddE/YHI9
VDRPVGDVSATTLHTLRVFLGPDGGGGNPLGVVLDGAAVPPDARQAVAADLGFSETVFVDDRATGALRIFTPTVELPLAGHPLVGTAWLLAHTGTPVDTLRPPAGDVPTWVDGELTWIRAREEWARLYDVAQLGSAAEVDALAVPGGDAMVAAWAWEDEAAGRVRARVFPNGIGIEEDEATGAAALQLGAVIGRDIVIRQGVGSELHARPGDDGTVAVGGRVVAVSENVTSTGGPSLRGPKGETG